MADLEPPLRPTGPDLVAGDERALTEVRAWIARLVRGSWRFEDPESVVQDILLEVVELARGGRIRDDADLRPYVLTVARRSCVDAYRRQRLRRNPGIDALPPPVDARTPSTALAARERGSIAIEVLRRLSTSCRELLDLVFGQELGAREVGRRIGAREGTVRVRVHRCLERARGLRREIETASDDEGGP